MELSIDDMAALGFTGHRPQDLGGFSKTNPIKLRCEAQLDLRLEQAYQRGFRRFKSGYALGWDTWVANAVIRARARHPDIQLIAAIPFETQPGRWLTESKQEWEYLLREADEVWLTNEEARQVEAEWLIDTCNQFLNDKNLPTTSQVNRWMFGRNIWLVDTTREMLACWTGKTSGGTYNCIKYALSRGARVIAYDPYAEALQVLSA